MNQQTNHVMQENQNISLIMKRMLRAQAELRILQQNDPGTTVPRTYAPPSHLQKTTLSRASVTCSISGDWLTDDLDMYLNMVENHS
jgi:hypothetical protein